jgi:hypothetical protein
MANGNFSIGDKVKVKSQYYSAFGKKYEHYGEFLTVTSVIISGKRKKQPLFQFAGQSDQKWCISEYFELYDAAPKWNDLPEEEKKQFLRQLTVALYKETALYGAINQLINSNNNTKQ